MKKHKGILIVLLIIIVLASATAAVYLYYKENTRQTPAELMESERQKTELAYKENLQYALNTCKKYDFIVVLNPAHGGTDIGHENAFGMEKGVTLSICNQVIAENTDADIGIFLTRSQDVDINEEMRLSLINRVQPDLFIDVHLEKSANVNAYGTSVSYDTTYFDRKLSNMEFADIMEKSVVTAIEGFAVGIIDVTDKEDAAVLKGLTIPAVSIACGDMSNDKEGELLTREAYQKNIAKGILDGIYLAKQKLEE